MPYLIFHNTEHNEATVKDAEAEVTVVQTGNFSRSPDSVLQEVNIFRGGENRIIFDKVYTKTFRWVSLQPSIVAASVCRCEYQLQLYPFDTQRCLVEVGGQTQMFREKLTRNIELLSLAWLYLLQQCEQVGVPPLDQYGVRITPRQVRMRGGTLLTQYVVPAWHLRLRNASETGCPLLCAVLVLGEPDQGIVLVVVLKRRIVNELLTTYLPSILIIIIVYSTNFFKEFFFEAIVSVNLTSQLVLTTIFIR